MAQKGSGKRRQAPNYSADTMALRYMAGLALIALGVVIFLAVTLGLSGNIFEGLRRICFGLCGIRKKRRCCRGSTRSWHSSACVP